MWGHSGALAAVHTEAVHMEAVHTEAVHTEAVHTEMDVALMPPSTTSTLEPQTKK